MWPMSTSDYMNDIDNAILQAAKVMEMQDLDDEIGDIEHDTLWEERYHCGTCVVRTVMEVVWPSVEKLISSLEDEIARLNEVAKKGTNQ